jgi:hypothetical protein
VALLIFPISKEATPAKTALASVSFEYAARANRANAPPQQHHLAQGIVLGN